MHFSYYHPAKIAQNSELASRLGFDEGFLESKIGIKQRYQRAKGETTSDMCVSALKALSRERSEFDPTSVDLILLCTQNGDYRIPHTSAILQDKMGVPDSAMCLDISLGCSGFVYGLSILKGLFQSGAASNALFFTCDPYTSSIDPHDRNTVLLFSDAAAVLWLTREDVDTTFRIGFFDFGTDGKCHEALIYGGGALDGSGSQVGPLHYKMDGRSVYQNMMRRIPKNVDRCLELNGKSKDDIDYFVFHQASGHILTSLQRVLRIPDGRMVRELSDIGNTVSSTIPIAMARLARGEALKGKTVLLCGFGVGLSWASVIVEL